MKQYQETPSSTRIRYPGICSLCNIASTCIYPRDSTRPLLFCDEFDCSSIDSKCTDPDPAAIKTCARSFKPETERAEKSEGKKMGLCRLCDNRPTCTYPKSPAGIWHCEEYK